MSLLPRKLMHRSSEKKSPTHYVSHAKRDAHYFLISVKSTTVSSSGCFSVVQVLFIPQSALPITSGQEHNRAGWKNSHTQCFHCCLCQADPVAVTATAAEYLRRLRTGNTMEGTQILLCPVCSYVFVAIFGRFACKV